MKTKLSDGTVKALVEWRDTDFMRANPEYQRGEVWNLDQQRKLIDSIFRGYQLPIIYLHKIKVESHGMVQDRLEIIDGQQRINALHRYVKGEFKLFDVADPKAKFPEFLKDLESHPCPWGGKDYDGLPVELKEELNKKSLPIAFIEDADTNEVRDLFVRLQAGFPLNAQEKRDSLPGEFADFIMKLGGKPERIGYPGHDFFTKVLGMKPSTDRGRCRQLAAQIAILFLQRQKNGTSHFCDLKRAEIDEFYYSQLDFDSASSECERLRKILDILHALLWDWSGPKLVAHNAIHLVLLVDSLLDDYTSGWATVFKASQEQFSALHAEATLKSKNRDLNGKWLEHWQEYGTWTRAGSDSSYSIKRRHDYYVKEMLRSFGDDLVPKDPNRSFNSLERQVIFWRDGGTCQVCDSGVDFDHCEIHHLSPHKDGGRTVLSNGVLVHDFCHPKSDEAIREFRNLME